MFRIWGLGISKIIPQDSLRLPITYHAWTLEDMVGVASALGESCSGMQRSCRVLL